MNDSGLHISESESHDFQRASRIVADTASDAIITINEDSTILFINRAAEKFYGFVRAEAMGRTSHHLFPKETADMIVAYDKKLLESRVS